MFLAHTGTTHGMEKRLKRRSGDAGKTCRNGYKLILKMKSNYMAQDNIAVIGYTIYKHGLKIPPPPSYSKSSHNSVSIINDKLYINGYEWKDGKWKITFAALWHLLF